tara:strand:+ start:166 stop:363 length:198 start_codon:yes stop_codon:yes gene_type:complete
LYREKHLQVKSDECRDIWHEWFKAEYEEKNKEKAKEIRKKWCKCVTEFGDIVSQEVKTNSRYNNL